MVDLGGVLEAGRAGPRGVADWRVYGPMLQELKEVALKPDAGASDSDV